MIGGGGGLLIPERLHLLLGVCPYRGPYPIRFLLLMCRFGSTPEDQVHLKERILGIMVPRPDFMF